MGHPHKMRGISIQLLQGLPQCVGPLHPRRSLSPRLALTASSRWLTREVELATARAALVSFRKWPPGLEATWSLLASKADPAALGTLRTHGCCCRRGTLTKACPAHVLCAQRADIRIWFPERHSAEGVPHLGLPLFTTSSGEPCSILDITAIIEAAAVQVGLPRRSLEGLTRWTWHLLRVGGAQSLAIAGSDTWTIQLVGRWGTEAVLGYVRLALLALSRTWAARASAGPGLGAQLGTVVSRSTQPHDSEVLDIRACWAALKSELQHELEKLKESSTRAESDT